MGNRGRVVAVMLALSLLCGCAGPVYRDIGPEVSVVSEFRTLKGDPEGTLGMYVLLGGEILETRVEEEGTSILVLQQPLGRKQRPKGGKESEGRFLVWYADFLDPYLFRRGQCITVGGLMGGTKLEPVGESEYPHVLIYGKEIHLWDAPEWPLVSGGDEQKQWLPWWYDPYYGERPWWW